MVTTRNRAIKETALFRPDTANGCLAAVQSAGSNGEKKKREWECKEKKPTVLMREGDGETTSSPLTYLSWMSPFVQSACCEALHAEQQADGIQRFVR